MASITAIPKVRITCDGLGRSIRIYDTDGKEILKGAVRGIRYTADCREAAKVYVELAPGRVELDAVGELVGMGSEVSDGIKC